MAVELMTVDLHWTRRSGAGSVSERWFEVRFRPDDLSHDQETRRFPTPESRGEFLEEAFTRLELAHTESPEHPEPVASILAGLVGRQLASVEFVRDYVQLHFDGPSLSYLLFPELTRGADTIVPSESAYRDLLCSLIGLQVESADEWLDVGVAVEIGDTLLSLPVLRTPRVSAFELVMYQDEQGWGAWSAGEAPYVDS